MGETIAIAADHAGFPAKEIVKEVLRDCKAEVLDFGTDSEASVDYPDHGKQAVRAVLDGKAQRGVLVCGSGIGMSIVANRYQGIRAALVHDEETAEMSRRHNNANVLVLPGRRLDDKQVAGILRVWLETEFEGGRHSRRLEKIDSDMETC